MEIKELGKRSSIDQDKKLKCKLVNFEKLITELRKRKISSEIVISVNQNIEEVNSFYGSNKDLRKQICKSQSKILKLLEKDLKLVTRNHYRNMWLAIGMSAFGIPFGVAFGAILDNMGFIGMASIGMAIGIAIGTGMDKKAFEEGKQLDLEVSY